MTTLQIIIFSLPILIMVILVVLILINQQETKEDIDVLLDQTETILDQLEPQPTVSFTVGPISEQT